MNNYSRYTFKAKRKDNQEWVYGFPIIYASGNIKITIPQCRKDLQETSKLVYGTYEIIPETLCQCTGLQDIDGNYIFENDIILFDGTWEYLVFFKDIKWQILRLGNNATIDLYYFRNRASTMFKIIGNKFDKEED